MVKINTFKIEACHTAALWFTSKHILRQKKNYGNSNISPCKSIIFNKSSKWNQNPSRCYNSRTNFKFQHNTIVSRLSTRLKPRSFVRTLPVGAYFRRSIPKSPTIRCNVEETDRQALEWVPTLQDHLKTEQDEPSKQTCSSAWVRC